MRALSGRYVDFWRATEKALIFAARTMKLELNEGHRGQLMQAYLELKAWPDVPEALDALKQANIRKEKISSRSG